ncbi:unnamed protein product [Ilex paraguariensis]|uniref:F-box domain-containing protein n=1 Tax=Ilex paraguariensis TaxID=185542 RepID=A0ABC8TRW8_9AQUA
MDCPTVLDRLSDLPWDILDNILGHLPIKDAVRTSVLSRKWRYKWIDLSKLVVDDSCGATTSMDMDKEWNQLAKVVYNVLLAHRGQIDKFMLSTLCAGHGNDVDYWIAFLSRNGIKELILDFNYMYEYELPSSLFSCQQLSCLYITDCSVITPHTFNGFSNLVSLQLQRCRVLSAVLENLISSCPILEALVLLDLDDIGLSDVGDLGYLNICAPNLKYLHIEGKFMSIHLEHSLRLTELSLKMAANWNMAHDTAPFLGFVSHLERLSLCGHLLRGFPVGCDNLKVLELSEVHFDELDEISVFLSLLRSSSNLKSLSLSASGPFQQDVYKLMTTQNQLSYCFNQLQIVKINISVCGPEEEEIQCWRSDLEFIKLLLACSPILEKMLVDYKHPEECDIWFMRKLLSFKRPSAQLIFKYTSSPNPEIYSPPLYIYHGWD